jgi:hypothetical protein
MDYTDMGYTDNIDMDYTDMGHTDNTDMGYTVVNIPLDFVVDENYGLAPIYIKMTNLRHNVRKTSPFR